MLNLQQDWKVAIKKQDFINQVYKWLIIGIKTVETPQPKKGNAQLVLLQTQHKTNQSKIC